MLHSHSVVPIGGSPFVHPALPAATCAPASPSGSSDSGASSLSDAASSGSSGGHSAGPDAQARAYAAAVLAHTRAMWAAERASIERARLDGGPSRSPTASPTSPVAAPRQHARHARGRSDAAAAAAAEPVSPVAGVSGIFRSLTVGRGRRRERS